jgi:DNA-binding protein HU-beta
MEKNPAPYPALFIRRSFEFAHGLLQPLQPFGPFDNRLMEGWRMTQTQVMDHLAEKVGISKKDAKLILDEPNVLVVRELKKEGSIRRAGLGIFRKRKLAARVGRNPATGEQIKIPARTRLRFTPAKALKESVLGASATPAKAKSAAKVKPAAAKTATKKLA